MMQSPGSMARAGDDLAAGGATASYTINIAINQQALTQIWQAGQAVNLVRTVHDFAGNAAARKRAETSAMAVVWQAFQPFQTNAITWTETFHGFASTTALQIDSSLALSAQTGSALQPGMTSVYKGGHFAPGGAAADDALALQNASSANNLAFGLAQSATINARSSGLAPLCAVAVLAGESAQFFPQNTLLIFISSCRQRGTLIPMPADGLILSLNGAGRNWNLGFNESSNQFFIKV
jgi:hypothetical protein